MLFGVTRLNHLKIEQTKQSLESCDKEKHVWSMDFAKNQSIGCREGLREDMGDERRGVLRSNGVFTLPHFFLFFSP